jgi:malonate-semialdehyde dehydrogenase (acetylating)/methylmalonate-semialdehyde dehydrogenase
MTENGDSKRQKTGLTVIDNYIDGTSVPPSAKEYLDVVNPATGDTIASVAISPPEDVEACVASSKAAFLKWSALTMKSRAGIMLKFHALIRAHTEELAHLIVLENGKNYTEAVADVAKANETVEYACSLPQLAAGRTLAVSSGGVHCHDVRKPLGVVVSIVPFNFPLMVPFWTLPIALVMGNTFILKPSEKVPLTTHRMTGLLAEAGFPPGVVTVLQTNRPATVHALISHADVKAVTFVGSSPVAKIISTTCRALHKRCTALGGAKNHLVALEDCHAASTAADVVVSFAGCAGQRCMAASVLLLVGDQEKSNELLDLIVQKASAIEPGTKPGQVGPVIDAASHAKITSYIADAVDNCGAELLLDGRSWSKEGANFIGPTVLLHSSSSDKAMREEVFGPVLSVYRCDSWEEAIQIENDNLFGNAACIYTTNGGNAEWFLERFRAAMLGCVVLICCNYSRRSRMVL